MITSVYIHIPFCEHICTYCDFAKRYYNEELAFNYLEALEKEIKLKYHNEKIKTLYIGGGTPSSLSYVNLKKLMKIVQIFNFDKNIEFTFEVNPENIDEEKLVLLKENGATRISIGVESTNEKFLKYLGRHHNFSLVREKILLMKKVGFDNINVDLIYALPNETISDLEKDLENLISLDIKHISTYSLEIHKNTFLGIQKEENISEDLDSDMYLFICNYLKKNNFSHYEVSNFCKNNSFSLHNLVYWHNERYYGFGIGAASYIDNIRYTNTRSMKDYLDGNYLLDKEILSSSDTISYELILGFRLINGINKEKFKEKYQRNLVDMYNISNLISEGYLIDDGENIKVREDMIYVENFILENFV